MNKLLTKIVGVVLGTTMAVGVGVGVAVNNDRKTIDSQVRAADVSVASAIFNVTNNKSGVSDYTSTWTNTTNSFSWTLVNFNNNNTSSAVNKPGDWTIVKTGNKSSASVGTITTASAVGDTINKVTITIDALTSSKVNSIKLYGGSDATTELGSFEIGTGSKTVEIASNQQAANQKYKVAFDCQKGSSNGLVTLSKVELFKEESDVYPTSISCASQSVDVLNTVDLSTQVVFTNSGGSDVTVKNLSYEIATGSDYIDLDTSTGIVKGKKGGTATVTISADTNNSGGTTSCVATINVSSISAPTLTVGDKYAICATDSTHSYSAELTGVASNVGTCNEISADTPSFNHVWTIGEGYYENTVTFKKGDDYLALTAEENKLHTSSSVNANSSWKVTWNSTTHEAVVINAVYLDRSLQFNYATSQQSFSVRFACYATEQTPIKIFHYVEEVVNDPTTLTMDTKSMILEEGQTAEEALTFTTDSPSATFAWYSENNSKATVNNGVVTAVGNSGTVKIYVYFDSNKNGSFDLSDLSDYCTVTLTAPAVDYSSVTYGGIGTKITSDNASTYIADGKKIIISDGSTCVAGALTSGYLPYVTNSENISVSFSNSNNTVTVGNGTSELAITVLTLKATTGGYFLQAKDGKYLVVPGSGSTGSISFSESAGTNVWTVDSTQIYGNSKNTIMANTSANPKRFKTYATTYSGTAPVLYSFVEYTDEALAYSETFIKGNGSANTCAATISNWATLGNTYSTTLSAGAKNLFKNATHNAPETYTNPTEYTIQHCVARYDDALLKHTELRSNEFMEREAAGTLSYGAQVTNNMFGNAIANNTAVVATVVIFSVISLSTLCGYFLLRKRKEER